MSERNRNFVLILFGIPALVGCLVAFKLYEGLYNEILEPRDVRQLNVEEVPGTHPTILNISIQPFSSAAVLRAITTKQRGQVLIVLAHAGMSGFVKPNSNWGKNFELTVPDSFNEVQFGHSKMLIWKRGSALPPFTERH
jgi:hypothetical protein